MWGIMATKLLIIDDNPSITDMLELVLPPEGFEVTTVNSGNEGIELTKALNPDVVILDLMMPGIDGWRVCKEIRAFSEVPILILSAVVETEEVSKAINVGANDYLVKPAPLEKLISHVNKLAKETPKAEVSR
jgi:DNA-binding response OmpR family regulator